MKIVVFACDVYADVADKFEFCLHKNYPDCPYPVEYVTNEKLLDVSEKVYCIKGPEIDWGARFKLYMERHFRDPDGLILVMMVDYLIVSADQELIARAEALCKLNSVSHVRLRPMPHPQRPYKPDSDFGEIIKGTRYSVSLQPGIWVATVLADIVKAGDSPWAVETRGSGRSKRRGRTFLSTQQTAIVHHNYYRKGSVAEWAVDWLKSQMEGEPNGKRETNLGIRGGDVQNGLDDALPDVAGHLAGDPQRDRDRLRDGEEACGV